MARDRGLEDLLRGEMPREGVVEKGMFGGWAWMVDGRLTICARDDGMLARLGKGEDAWALALPGIEKMRSGAREMSGWVRANPDAYGDDALRRRLIGAALKFVRGLPPR